MTENIILPVGDNMENKARVAAMLKHDGKGRPLKSIENFVTILQQDTVFAGLRFNSLTSAAEGAAGRWTDMDDALARRYIENTYGLYNPQKLEDALAIVAGANSYHPVKQLIEAVEWDGVDRVSFFLTKWLNCPDDVYTRQVSQLIFAGGIHRLYNPGCKFDTVPVLIGVKQGEGKSTIVRWLALRDDFFSEVTEIEGQKGIESIEGSWICEIAELLALTRAKEVEAVKSYISKQTDKYRKPYERRVVEIPRQCIFIGTTNRRQFLTDKTGNRRFLPVKCQSDGHSLYRRQDRCKQYILQCWRQAKAMYDAGTLDAVPQPLLTDEIKQAQQLAAEDDYREGMIREYLIDKNAICIIDIWENALGNPFTRPSKKESNDIGLIMQSMPEWIRAEKPMRFGKYGVQRAWLRKNFTEKPEKA